MWKLYNPNPKSARVGDCVIRAISKTLGQTWQETYIDLAMEGFRLCDMPSANHVWGSYLHKNGYIRTILPDECQDCYTVKQFCRDYPTGNFLLALSGHVVAVQDGDYYDTWDSGDEVPVYFWKESER